MVRPHSSLVDRLSCAVQSDSRARQFWHSPAGRRLPKIWDDAGDFALLDEVDVFGDVKKPASELRATSEPNLLRPGQGTAPFAGETGAILQTGFTEDPHVAADHGDPSPSPSGRDSAGAGCLADRNDRRSGSPAQRCCARPTRVALESIALFSSCAGAERLRCPAPVVPRGAARYDASNHAVSQESIDRPADEVAGSHVHGLLAIAPCSVCR